MFCMRTFDRTPVDLRGIRCFSAWHAPCAMGSRRVFTMNIRIKGWIAAAALVAFVAVPLAASAGQAAPPAGAQAQAASASGELVKVDAAAKTLTIKADGRDQEFTFNEQTKITGAQGAAGLA